MEAMTSPGAGGVLQALRRRLARGGRAVVVRETHLSWIVLGGRLAVKLKKPVRLPFVDFGTPAARRQACEEELRLNRRLAPSLYRRVVAVRGGADGPRFGGKDGGDEIDAVLCMRRFADGALLSERLAAGRLEPRDVERLALRIARFHEAAPPAPAAGDPIEEATRPMARVLAQLADFEPAAWCAAAARWLDGRRAELAPVFTARRAHGAVRDGHGDLHLANAVVLGDDVTAFDCIEFDPALRRIDVMADIAFMTMDLHAHGRPDLAHRFLDAYLAASGDYAGLALLRFHEAARACVRGLVQRLGPVAEGADAPDYLALATRRMSEGEARPRLAILCGPSGAGKSTIAARLVDLTGAVRVRSDVERKRLHAAVCAAGELHSPAATERTYGRLVDCARAAVRAGFDVIVDAAFLERARRDAFAVLAAELGVAFAVLAFDAPPQELARRVARRAAAGGDPSDADAAVLAAQLRSRDPIAPRERARTIVVDTAQAVDVERLAASWRAHPSSIAG